MCPQRSLLHFDSLPQSEHLQVWFSVWYIIDNTCASSESDIPKQNDVFILRRTDLFINTVKKSHRRSYIGIALFVIFIYMCLKAVFAFIMLETNSAHETLSNLSVFVLNVTLNIVMLDHFSTFSTLIPSLHTAHKPFYKINLFQFFIRMYFKLCFIFQTQ